MTIAARLQQALARRKKSIRWLQSELKAVNVPASSYGSVRAYVKGDTTPRPDWLQAAAAVLGVRMEWLARGTGAMTQAEEELRRDEEGEEEADAAVFEELDADAFASRVDWLLSKIAAVVSETVDDYNLPYEFRIPLKAFLNRFYGGAVARTPGLVEQMLSGGIEWRRFVPSAEKIRRLVDERFGPALDVSEKSEEEALAALYSQLASLLISLKGMQEYADPTIQISLRMMKE
jgi:hypothetical protein